MISHREARVRDNEEVSRFWSRMKFTRLSKKQNTTEWFPLRWILAYFSSRGLIRVDVRSGAIRASYVNGVSCGNYKVRLYTCIFKFEPCTNL